MTLGVVVRPQLAPEELEAVVRYVDRAGVPQLWLWEDCFLEGGTTSATAALAWTEQVQVGVGLFPAPLRNPALLAMELATVLRLWPARFLPALGHGVQSWMAQVGAQVESPMTLLREYALAVRALLDGDRVDVDGRYVRLDGVALDWPPTTRPELLLGARGARTIRLAGEVADGVLLDSVTDPERVRAARRLVDEGRATPARVTVYTQVEPHEVEERVSLLRDAGADTVVLQGSGERPDPRPLVDALVDAALLP